jgi:hypothetical protein
MRVRTPPGLAGALAKGREERWQRFAKLICAADEGDERRASASASAATATAATASATAAAAAAAAVKASSRDTRRGVALRAPVSCAAAAAACVALGNRNGGATRAALVGPVAAPPALVAAVLVVLVVLVVILVLNSAAAAATSAAATAAATTAAAADTDASSFSAASSSAAAGATVAAGATAAACTAASVRAATRKVAWLHTEEAEAKGVAHSALDVLAHLVAQLDLGELAAAHEVDAVLAHQLERAPRLEQVRVLQRAELAHELDVAKRAVRPRPRCARGRAGFVLAQPRCELAPRCADVPVAVSALDLVHADAEARNCSRR